MMENPASISECLGKLAVVMKSSKYGDIFLDIIIHLNVKNTPSTTKDLAWAMYHTGEYTYRKSKGIKVRPRMQRYEINSMKAHTVRILRALRYH